MVQLDNVCGKKTTVDIITISNLNNDNLVMSEAEIQNLANQLDIIKKYFKRITSTSKTYLNFGWDLELNLMAQIEIYISNK